MAARRDPLHNPLALTVLAYLIERPMHPYEIGKLLKQRNADRNIDYKHASLYMVVDQLARAGYIAAAGTERDGARPERTLYTPTETGETRLREHLREMVAVPGKEYRQFEAVLSLIVVLRPEEVPALLEQRQRALTRQAAQQRSVLAAAHDVDQLFLIEYHYRLELIEAEQRFIDRFRNLIEREPAALGPFWQQLHGHPPIG
ncbi:PadR family transcriptional regulator [Nocardia blacklockiae]|uniref:PadR family transcriptional regulator n=1 Tax=Nocardia blacklockiae TaxID=480036 RepID=UPI0018957B8C|nr:PadR family transcriptional regulator [Nocardia blacklockiae]MBF6174977.1 PadR family transcriptional regulator [Nocardia blacklockiae]